MFQSSRKTMKWSSLLKDIKEKVGLSSSPSPSSPYSEDSIVAAAAAAAVAAAGADSAPPGQNVSVVDGQLHTRGRHDLELDFKRYWEEFRSSSSEKEKEAALNMSVDIFCRLVRQQMNVVQLVTTLVEAHIFSFVVGRAFVTDVEKLRIHSKSKSLHATKVMSFFSKVREDDLSPGSNLLFAVEVLVSGPIDKQPLLDSGILCCLIHILNALLNSDEVKQGQPMANLEISISHGKPNDKDNIYMRQLEVEGSVVHIMKALSSHPSAALSLIEDDSLQLLFQMVANGSLTVFARFRKGLVPLHTIQLHRHAMQILGLILVNDNGSTAKYIHKNHLIKILLTAVKDFDPESGDSAYTMGIVDLLLECVELSYRLESGSIRLREDIHNAHGYHFLVQFALKLSNLQKNQDFQSLHSTSSDGKFGCESYHPSPTVTEEGFTGREASLPPHLSPSLSRLLDVLVNLAQTGPSEPVSSTGGKGSRSTYGKSAGHNRSHTSSIDKIGDEMWEKGNSKVRDLEAIQMLQDIFLKADCIDLQAEVLNRMFKIFSSHIDNYKLCQQLRTMPLFILNMAGFPTSLQEIILKILEYAVTVVNCIPEQELLSLCCLLQQPITSSLKHTILSFFVKLISFDQQYKKVLREVGVLEVLIDDLKEHKLIAGAEPHNKSSGALERKPSCDSFKKHLDSKDAILSSPKLIGSNSGRFHVFEDEGTIAVAWDCLVSLLKKTEASQSVFRSSNGFTTVLPFLVSDLHRSGVLRMLSCLIIEDTMQVHPEELGAVIEILKSGIVTSTVGAQYRLGNDAKCDTFGALWRILVANSASQRIFGEATGFSILLTILHSFRSDDPEDLQSLLAVHMKVFCFLFRAIIAGVCNNVANRTRVHSIISSQTFYDLLCDSGLLCVDYEKQVIQLLLELALEVVVPPSGVAQVDSSSSDSVEIQSENFLSIGSLASISTGRERLYNASAVGVLVRSLLLFTPKVQLEVLIYIEKLANAGPFNKENLTSIGCVGLLLEKITPFLVGTSSPLLTHALRIVEVLGTYRLSSLELRELIRYILQMKSYGSGHLLTDMMERLLQMQDTRLKSMSLAPYVEMDMSKIGHASIQVSLGERTWPPTAGYSFVFWFQYHNRSSAKEQEQPFKANSGMRSIFSGHSGRQMLHLFSVGAMDDTHTSYAELTLQDNGVFCLSTSNSCSLSFPSVELEEGRWHHLAVVHSKPNSLAGLFQPSVAYLYLDGKLRHTGKLGYSLSPVGKALQVTMGTPHACARTNELSWRLRCCYLFEEVLPAGSICFMYILGRGYKGIFQDTDLLQFVPNQACGGGSMSILDSLDADVPMASNLQRLDTTAKQGNTKVDGSGIVWDFERLGNLSLQLSGKKLIFAFDGTSSESLGTSGTRSLVNLVDPMSSAASPIGGIPRFGRLYGDIYICHQCPIGDSIRSVGGIPVILALIEAAETREMLHMALALLACALHQNPQNVQDMQAYRGYHLLAIFLHRRMSLFDMQSLENFFQIAACETSFPEQQKLSEIRIPSSAPVTPDASFEDLSLPKFSDEVSSSGSHGDSDEFSVQKDSFSRLSEFEGTDLSAENSNCIVLSNADMVEHVLLDWTLWVTAPVSIQLALLGFLERMVSMHWYRNHNLTILRRINLVQHLLVTLQRGDVDVRVLEKLVVLLGVILEDGFLTSELEIVVRFIIMTFDPPEPTLRYQILRESMGKHVIVRNMLLEMLIELQETIRSEDLLEQWHKIVSSKLITYFLDEAVHPTSMRWIMTLLGVCIASSPTFALKFRNSGGYQGLTRVLPNFYDSPEIFYILFCLIFGKSVYPRVPEVRMGDFHSLMPGDGSYTELKFVELLDSVVSMAKSTFDRLSIQSMHAHQSGNTSNLETLVAEIVAASDNIGDLQGEALMHKTSARLMGGEAAAPAAATSVLRFMVDLAKLCPSFSAICRRTEFLESCVDLYFSCVRADYAVKMAKDLLTSKVSDEKIMEAADDNQSSRHTFSSLPHELEQSSRTSISIESYPAAQKSVSSGEMSGMVKSMSDDNAQEGNSTNFRHSKSVVDGIDQGVQCFDTESIEKISYCTHDLNFRESNGNVDTNAIKDSFSYASSTMPNSPVSSEKSNSKMLATPSSPVIALTSWLGNRANQNETKMPPNATSVGSGLSINESDVSPDLRFSSQGSNGVSMFFPINPKLLLDIDDSGYGGGPCSAAATAILDFIALVLADIISEQVKASQYVEGILETVPMLVDIDSALVFQGLCLSRLMNFLESRLIRDDEEDEKRLDKSRWSANLDSLCSMIVDRVYMGAFPHPYGVLRTLEFLLSMLQLANKDRRIEEALPVGNVLLSIARANRQLEPYVQSLLRSTNRMVMYCFLPLFLATIQEDGLLSRLGFQMEFRKGVTTNASNDDSSIDICTFLQLLVAHKHLVLCPSNLDNDMMCCLCVNLISLLRDQRQTAKNLAVDLTKYLLLHRRAALEELLISKPNQGLNLNVLHGGFDKLITGGSTSFFDWFQSMEQAINKVLEQCATIMWVQYIAGASKFPGIRIKGMESRRKKEMGRKARDTSRLDLRHWDQINERRYALELVRESMSTELRVIRQDKYGWVLHAESEWQTHLLQLIHERGIFPVRICSAEPEWLLCPIEGPYRMRKKLERFKLKIDTIQNVLGNGLELEFKDRTEDNFTNDFDTSEMESEPFFNLIKDDINQDTLEDIEYNESFFKRADIIKGEDSASNAEWNDDQASSINEASLHSAFEFGVKSSNNSVQITDSTVAKSDSSPRQSSPMKIEDIIAAEDRSEKEIHDNGEYLIRPFLEPMEKIRFKYNCERVVGLDKHDGIFLIGDLCLYVIEYFYIDDTGCICEKESEDGLSIIDKALGVKKDASYVSEFQLKSPSSWGTTSKALVGGRAWAYGGGAWGKEKVCTSSNIPHLWHMWKLDSVHELLKRDYQLRPVAIEIFSMDGCNDLLVFHKKEREDVFKNLVAMNLPRNNMLDTTISGSSRQESNEGSRLFKMMAKSFSKRWQNGEISNFQYLMHLNTLAGRGYSDLTQYPVFPWVLADYESESLDLTNPRSFRKLDKPMGCQTAEGEEEFRKRYESWDDPDVPKFHYGSHYSSAGIVLFYLLRLPPFSIENQKLQGGQFDHADRLFNSIRDTWLSAAGKGNTSDVKELIPEFFYMPEFLENHFNLDLGEKQSGEKVGDVVLPPWAKNSAREFIRKHREALESDYVSENLHHWIDLIFGYKQRGKAAEEAVNVFYHYTYEGSVDIDSVTDPAMKASILAQINHFGQTPKQLFPKPHVKRRSDRKFPPHPLRHCAGLLPHEMRKSSSISQIVSFHDKILTVGTNSLLKPVSYSKYIAWGFPDRSLRFMSYDQGKLLSTHESLHGGNQIQCAGISHDGQILVTGADDGVVAVWRINNDGFRGQRCLRLERALCVHTAKITCLSICQPYSLIVSGSDDCTVILWDLSGLAFVKQLPEFPAPVSAVHVNDQTGEIVTAAGILLAVWSVNGDCLAVVNTSQLPSDLILSLTTPTSSDWLETNWYVTGHQSGGVKVWNMIHSSAEEGTGRSKTSAIIASGLGFSCRPPEYKLILQRVLKSHKHPVTALHITNDLKLLLSGDSGGLLLAWTLPDESQRGSFHG